MAKLFVSYVRRDAADLAERLKDDLQANGHAVWQDTADIRSGQVWQERISSAIQGSDAVIALISPHSVRSSTDPISPASSDSVCLDELEYARFGRRPKPIIPVTAVSCVPPLSLFRLDYVDLTEFQSH